MRSDPTMINFGPVSPGFFMFNFSDADGANPIAALHNDTDSTPVGEPGLFPNSSPAAPAPTTSTLSSEPFAAIRSGCQPLRHYPQSRGAPALHASETGDG